MIVSFSTRARLAIAAGALAFAATAQAAPLKAVLADEAMLVKAGVKVLRVHQETGVAYAEITEEQGKEISHLAHEAGKCGGFELLAQDIYQGVAPQSPLITNIFGQLSEREQTNRRFVAKSSNFNAMMYNPSIQSAIDEVKSANLKTTVQMMSNFSDRLYNGRQPNAGVDSLKTLIDNTAKGAAFPVEVEYVTHRSIGQKSIRARLVGSTRPSEIVVLGGHLDSINGDWFGAKGAPGADDNASGSANLVEALRILVTKGQPERTVEIMWYAGEEGGLIGSAEIAQDYKKANKDVVAVLQLDMTLFPGDGQFVLGSMTDFTSAWLRSYLENLNGLYIKAKIVEDKCGYGCSDHASWHRQGYPAIMPFESGFNRMNKNIHTVRDVIDSSSNFEHSAMYSKIAVAMAMDLGNSSVREPK